MYYHSLLSEGEVSSTIFENSCNTRHSEALQSRKNPAYYCNTSKLKEIHMNNLTKTVFSRFTSHVSLPKVAFTLAEVLITLGIIGVVAAITIPTIVNHYKEKVTITKLKKLNSTFQNAFNLMRQEEFGGGDASEWGDISRDEFVQAYTKYLSVAQVCTQQDIQKCFYNTNYANLNGEQNQLYVSSYSGFILNDGAPVAVGWSGANSEYTISTGNYGQIFVDINGKNPPNILGRDVFSFIIRKDAVIARGTINPGANSSSKYDKQGYCNKNSGVGHNGLGCTAWVIYQENFDYLK